METDRLQTVLSQAGLSPYQVAAYLAVLERGSAAATEVATASEVPEARVYDVLRALEVDGYVETYEQGTLRVRARDPAEVLDLRERAERFDEAAGEIERRFERSAPAIETHEASVVSRFETVIEGARRAIENASDQVQATLTPSQFDVLHEALETAYEAGVDIRLSLVTDPRAGESTETLPDQKALAGSCTEARHRPLPASFLVIVDRTTACFAPHPEATDRYGVLVEDRAHAYVFHWFFLSTLWEACETVYDNRPAEPPIEYVDVRQCIREIAPLVHGNRAIDARVAGRDTETGESVTLAGRITDVRYAGESVEGRDPALAHLAIQATIVLETADRTWEIGGWGAILEPIEAIRVTIERVESG
jgi:HTH-type transcriptional regulator, sugar sensing transcriptional regulator